MAVCVLVVCVDVDLKYSYGLSVFENMHLFYRVIRTRVHI